MILRALAALGLALTLGVTATTASAAPRTAPDVRLYALDCGRIEMADADFYADDGSLKGVAGTLVVPCFLIRHPKGDLLWNTGVPQKIAGAPLTADGETITVAHRLTDQLRALGLAPADIEYLSLSHSHFDHIGNAGLFADSTWIVDADERAHAFRPKARADTESFAAYAALEGARTVLIEGERDHDVFGDGSVTIVQAPGHTPGHTVLLVRFAQSRPVLLSGDMWHFAASQAARRVPRFNTDRNATLRSMDKVEALAAHEHAILVREHVPEDVAALPRFPRALR